MDHFSYGSRNPSRTIAMQNKCFLSRINELFSEVTGQMPRLQTGALPGNVVEYNYSFTWRRRSALVITETELNVIAAAAMIGLRSSPKNGYSTPAATGMPIEL